MNKKNILLIIFLALFLIPELLWLASFSVFLSFFDIYHISKETYRDTFSNNLVSIILFLQLVGITGFLVSTSKLKTINPKIKFPTIAVSIILGIVVLFSFLVSVSLRSPGF